jgi:serine/threonine protein kinase
MFTAEAKLWQS